MENETAYMLGAVLTVFAVTYALRALPFLLFAGRDRALPPWVERASAFVSPVIIAGLIVYSFAGLSWRTPWPYLAGAVTVGLHLWRRNPLASIAAGTEIILYFDAEISPDTEPMPDLTGMSYEKARDTLSYYGLYLTTHSRRVDSEQQTVGRQSFTPGTMLRHGTVVEVTLIDRDEEMLGKY